jgi:hypothetical protein
MLWHSHWVVRRQLQQVGVKVGSALKPDSLLTSQLSTVHSSFCPSAGLQSSSNSSSSSRQQRPGRRQKGTAEGCSRRSRRRCCHCCRRAAALPACCWWPQGHADSVSSVCAEQLADSAGGTYRRQPAGGWVGADSTGQGAACTKGPEGKNVGCWWPGGREQGSAEEGSAQAELGCVQS